MKAKVLAGFYVEKLQKVELEFWKTEKPMCKADTHANRSGSSKHFGNSGRGETRGTGRREKNGPWRENDPRDDISKK